MTTPSLPRSIVTLMRPMQWVKNTIILTGPLFSYNVITQGQVIDVLYAVVAFTLLSSSIYTVNDIADRHQDRLHPRKKHRPIAAGNISIALATNIAFLLAAVALTAGYLISPAIFYLMALYTLLNISYSYGLKHIVIIDVFMIAGGFMLRILVGTLGIGIHPSQWLLLCGLMFTLFLGFAKRRAELVAIPEPNGESRKVLAKYDLPLLDILIAITATCSVITYGLYTVSPNTVQTHGTENLIYTLPFVLYGVFRYLYRLYSKHCGEDPAVDIFTDIHIVITLLAWAAMVVWIIR